MTIKEQILELFANYNELSVKEIVDKTGASKQMVHLVLGKLLNEGKVLKMGRTPKTVYHFINKPNLVNTKHELILNHKETEFLENNFVVVTETGNLLRGIAAFEHWCAQRKLPAEKTYNEFLLTKKKYAQYYNRLGLVNGTEKLMNTKGYEKIWLDELFYLDFYAIERFGKTALGTMLHYAKQGQNKYLMKMMMDAIANRINEFIKHSKADAIGFVPPTIRREVQLMKFIQTHLKINLPVIEIKKVSGIIPVPQKSLSKLEERIRNAESTFAITERANYRHIVLIDDAVGSGSTLNQIAGKIKSKGVAKKITGLAIVGSFKGFDVITDV